jgi:hypothetical protein
MAAEWPLSIRVRLSVGGARSGLRSGVARYLLVTINANVHCGVARVVDSRVDSA